MNDNTKIVLVPKYEYNTMFNTAGDIVTRDSLSIALIFALPTFVPALYNLTHLKL
jgi:hypothetical protein